VLGDEMTQLLVVGVADELVRSRDQGEARYDELEKRLAEGPVITVPAITLEGDANGAPQPELSAYATKFSGAYTHRTIEGGIRHNLPQEAPEAFAGAVIDVAGRK
jgi:hypothetical protein